MAKTLDDKRFLLKHDASIGVTIFSTQEALNLLEQCTSVLGDATFKASPETYDQLYILFGDFDEFTLPLISSYRNGKSASTSISIAYFGKTIFDPKN